MTNFIYKSGGLVAVFVPDTTFSEMWNVYLSSGGGWVKSAHMYKRNFNQNSFVVKTEVGTDYSVRGNTPNTAMESFLWTHFRKEFHPMHGDSYKPDTHKYWVGGADDSLRCGYKFSSRRGGLEYSFEHGEMEDGEGKITPVGSIVKDGDGYYTLSRLINGWESNTPLFTDSFSVAANLAVFFLCGEFPRVRDVANQDDPFWFRENAAHTTPY